MLIPRIGDLRISAIYQLQSSALPTELSRAHTKNIDNNDSVQQESDCQYFWTHTHSIYSLYMHVLLPSTVSMFS